MSVVNGSLNFDYFRIMASAIDFSEQYTYADYLSWTEEDRWEIISGHPYNMSPAPGRRHQAVLGRLHGKFFKFFDTHPCDVYIAPFDVRLSEDHSDDHLVENVVQPDLSVFCDADKLDDKGAIGAPDLVVEVLSPSTAAKDMKTKLLLYQKFGVREYWLVDTEKNTLERMTLDAEGRYNPGMVFDNASIAESAIFPELKIELEPLFLD